MQRDVGGVKLELARFLILGRGERFRNLAVLDDVILFLTRRLVDSSREHAYGFGRVRLGNHLGARIALSLDATTHKGWITHLHERVIDAIRVHMFNLTPLHVGDDALARQRGVNTTVSVRRLGHLIETLQDYFPSS